MINSQIVMCEIYFVMVIVTTCFLERFFKRSLLTMCDDDLDLKFLMSDSFHIFHSTPKRRNKHRDYGKDIKGSGRK